MKFAGPFSTLASPLGSPRIDESPVSEGVRGKGGARRSGRGAPPSPRSDGLPLALVAREAGDQEVEELARDGRVSAVQSAWLHTRYIVGCQRRKGHISRVITSPYTEDR